MLNFKNSKIQIKCFIAFIALTILYHEHLIYILSSLEWPPFMQCGSRNKHCLKVLFVADPQLIGERYEQHIFPAIARWDSDRYIEKNFAMAIDKFKPDAVIFLGDLMDEGSIAEIDEFARYLFRLQVVFPPDMKLQYIWIPGDNDIGGEGYERVSVNKIQRFQAYFKQDNIISVNGIDFIKINRMIHEIPKLSSEKITNRTNVILSHMPILYVPGGYSKAIITTLSPSLIFSAHEHKSLSIRANRHTPMQRTITQLTKKEKVKRYRIGSDTIHEFVVPTCSYRMGVEDAGFGAAVINGYGSYLDYTVLWFPSRLQTLRNYLYIICIIFVLIVIRLYYCLKTRCKLNAYTKQYCNLS